MKKIASAIIAALMLASAASAYELPNSKKPKLSSDAEHLQKISRGIAAVAGHAKRGIVFVSVEKVVKGQPFGMINPFDFFFGPGPGGPQGEPGRPAPEFKQKGLGSGFFVDLEKGYVMTNNHVIEGADEISLKLDNGDTHTAKVVGRDPSTDVAVVQIQGKFNKQGLVQLSLGDSANVTVGDICVAVGAPFGLEASISMGVVSAIGRGSLRITDLGNFIQTDAAINPGNSGGPLLNSEGEVIGINTAIYSKSGGYNGIGFAIPANMARDVANQLIDTGKVDRGYLGVLLSEMDPDLAKEMKVPSSYKGALVRSIEPGTPADKGGLEAGDVVVTVGDQKVENVQHLRNVIGLQRPGASVKLGIIRNGSLKTLNVRLGNFADATVSSQETKESGEFGLTLSNPNPKLRQLYGFESKDGAVVTGVEENSGANRAGIQEGDLIVKVNDKQIRSAAEFFQYAKGKDRVLLRIERRGQYLFTPLRK